MEPKYAAQIRPMFPRESLPPIRSLEIPDDYEFMAPELVEILTGAVKTVESTPEKSNRRR